MRNKTDPFDRVIAELFLCQRWDSVVAHVRFDKAFMVDPRMFDSELNKLLESNAIDFEKTRNTQQVHIHGYSNMTLVHDMETDRYKAWYTVPSGTKKSIDILRRDGVSLVFNPIRTVRLNLQSFPSTIPTFSYKADNIVYRCGNEFSIELDIPDHGFRLKLHVRKYGGYKMKKAIHLIEQAYTLCVA